MSGTKRGTVWRGFCLLPQGSAQGIRPPAGEGEALCSQESSQRAAQAFLTHGEPTRGAAAAHQNPQRARLPAPYGSAACAKRGRGSQQGTHPRPPATTHPQEAWSSSCTQPVQTPPAATAGQWQLLMAHFTPVFWVMLICFIQNPPQVLPIHRGCYHPEMQKPLKTNHAGTRL